jgi:hypothetical protein
MNADSGIDSGGTCLASGEGKRTSRKAVCTSCASLTLGPAVLDYLFLAARLKHRAAIQPRPSHSSFQACGADQTSDFESGINVSAVGLNYDRQLSAIQASQKPFKELRRVRRDLSLCGYPLDTGFLAIAVSHQSKIHRPFRCQSACGSHSNPSQGWKENHSEKEKKWCKACANCHYCPQTIAIDNYRHST